MFDKGVFKRPWATTTRSSSEKLAHNRNETKVASKTCKVILAERGNGLRSISSASGRNSTTVVFPAVVAVELTGDWSAGSINADKLSCVLTVLRDGRYQPIARAA